MKRRYSFKICKPGSGEGGDDDDDTIPLAETSKTRRTKVNFTGIGVESDRSSSRSRTPGEAEPWMFVAGGATLLVLLLFTG
jgi:hypothetical protein